MYDICIYCICNELLQKNNGEVFFIFGSISLHEKMFEREKKELRKFIRGEKDEMNWKE